MMELKEDKEGKGCDLVAIICEKTKHIRLKANKLLRN